MAFKWYLTVISRGHRSKFIRSCLIMKFIIIISGVIVAPFTEFNYIHQFGNVENSKSDASEEREKRFKCAEQAFLSAMRSWSGMTQLCQTRPVGPSHLQAVVDILYLKNNEVRVS